MRLSSGLVVLLVVVALLVMVVATGAGQYNRLVTLENEVDAKWAQVENQLTRRADLIPNLVATTKGYAAHESQIFTDIAAARSKLIGADTPSETIAANNELDGALSRLLVIVENYPQLKADQQFRALSDELAGTENRIATERMRYNESVQVYNTTVKRFPMVFFARFFGKTERAFFAAPEGADQAPQVKF